MEEEIDGRRPRYRGGLLETQVEEDLPLDPLCTIGLGFGASQRARILAFKGLIAELDEAIQVEAEKASKASKGGAPRKFISKDEVRALSVICQVWNSPDGAYLRTSDVVRDLGVNERLSPQEKDREVQRMFQGGDATTLPSVTRGLAKLGMSSDNLLAKRWSEKVGCLLADLEAALRVAKNG